MRVLITGGYGFIGAWVIRKLLDRGHEKVWVYDQARDLRRVSLVLEPHELPAVEHFEGDITDLNAIQSALEAGHITHVLHLAALQVPFCQADPIRGANVNVLGTLCVFEAIKRLQDRIGHVVYASSAAVYGPPADYPEGPLSEEAPLKPNTFYGAYKVCNELCARAYWVQYGLSSAGVRPWTVYGVGRDQGLTSEPTKAIQAAALGRPYAISYGGTEDFQYVEDVAEILVRLLELSLPEARVYNLRGTVATMAEFVETLCQVAPEARGLVRFVDRQLPIAYDLDDRLLRTDLQSVPYTSLAEGIRRTLERFRALHRQGRLKLEELSQ